MKLHGEDKDILCLRDCGGNQPLAGRVCPCCCHRCREGARGALEAAAILLLPGEQSGGEKMENVWKSLSQGWKQGLGFVGIGCEGKAGWDPVLCWPAAVPWKWFHSNTCSTPRGTRAGSRGIQPAMWHLQGSSSPLKRQKRLHWVQCRTEPRSFLKSTLKYW